MARVGRLLLVAAAVGLCGCAGPGPGPAASSPAGTPSSEIRIGLSEWSIHTGGAVAEPGEVRLIVTNAGATAHDLTVEGERGSWRTPMIGPGEQARLTVDAAPAETLALDCSVPGHHDNGMYGTLEVAAASP